MALTHPGEISTLDSFAIKPDGTKSKSARAKPVQPAVKRNDKNGMDIVSKNYLEMTKAQPWEVELKDCSVVDTEAKRVTMQNEEKHDGEGPLYR